MWTTRFDALGTAVRIEAEQALACPLEAVFGSYRPCGGPAALDYGIEPGGAGHRLWRDEALVTESAEPLDLVACLEGDLYEQVGARSGGWNLHAAALADARGALVLAGESGAGKSTLALALVERGWRYLSDERAAIGAAGEVHGLLRPVGIGRGALAPIPTGARVVDYPTARPGPGVPRLVHLPEERLEPGPVPLRWLVQVRHAPAAPPELRRLSPGEALTLLWGQRAAGGRGEAWGVALRTVERIPAAVLVTRSIDQACRHLDDFVRAR